MDNSGMNFSLLRQKVLVLDLFLYVIVHEREPWPLQRILLELCLGLNHFLQLLHPLLMHIYPWIIEHLLRPFKVHFGRLHGHLLQEVIVFNTSQAKRFMQTVAIAAKCHKFINENLHTTIRGLYYQLKYSLGEDVDENIFNEQSESNPLIEDLEAALSIKRENLNLNANRKGVLAGNLKVMDTFGGEKLEIDASKQGRSGWAIPSDVDNDIEFVDVKAKSVLVVEKDALWQRLNEDGLWKKENMILISPQGQAARGTRRLIRKLADRGLPVYVFNDGDAWGWYIYWTIKTGSINLAYSIL